MFRVGVARISSPAIVAFTKTKRVRNFATEPPTGGDVKKPQFNNNLLYATLAAAVAGGAYWYYSSPDETANLHAKAKQEQGEAKNRVKEAGEAGKARLEQVYDQCQLKYDEVKSSADRTIQSADARARQAADDAHAKFDEYKKGASQGLNDARDSTENLYKDARATLDKKYGELKEDTQKKQEQASSSWFSWLGWGKSKTEDAKKAGAEKVSEAAGDVKSRSDKHT